MKKILVRAIPVWRRTTSNLDYWLRPLVDLAFRLALARVFFGSALQKLSDWGATLYLFQYEYQVPLLPPEVSAVLAASSELSMPVLLLLGLATRLAAIPLLMMAGIIEFVIGGANPAYHSHEHYFWMISLAYLVANGPGRLSLDCLIARLWKEPGE